LKKENIKVNRRKYAFKSRLRKKDPSISEEERESLYQIYLIDRINDKAK